MAIARHAVPSVENETVEFGAVASRLVKQESRSEFIAWTSIRLCTKTPYESLSRDESHTSGASQDPSRIDSVCCRPARLDSLMALVFSNVLLWPN